MTTLNSGLARLEKLALLGLLAVGATAAPLAAAGLHCLPTCSTTDGRFLAIAGAGFETLSPPEMDLSIAVPAGSATFDIGIFDGDGGEYGPGGEAFWDAGVTALFEYSLYADPGADGTGLLPVDLEPGSPTILSTDMPDNEWRNFTVATGSEAASPGGNFFYVLKVRLVNPALVTLNSYKVRTTAVVSALTLDPVARPFSYIASWTALNDISIVYPDFPNATPTTYDGIFRFYFDVPVSQDELTVWDGDFDHGKYDLTEQDTDDPNTPGAPFLPSWATPDTVPEGVAIGSPGTGSPPDDDNVGGFGAYIVRPPSIHYHVTAPDGQFYTNDNPSGNREWEQFTISTSPFDPLVMDASATSLPPGAYYMEVQGVDMINLNALLLPFRVLCMDEAGAPCAPLRPFLAGDTVYSDTDGNGVQNSGEPGVAGVAVELHDSYGALLGTATTDADGHYSFAVDKATYEVRVAAANFTTGPLAGFVSTTGGDSSTETVTDDNVLDFDFGYRATSPPSQPGTGTLGYWKTHSEAWPVAQITIGGITYSKSQAISLMGTPGRGDKTYDLFKQLVAAKLNVLIGNDSSCISATITAADSWMASHPVGSKVSARSSAWSTAGPLHDELDDYNNGELCAPHRG